MGKPEVLRMATVSGAMCAAALLIGITFSAGQSEVDPLSQFQLHTHNTTTDHFSFQQLHPFSQRYFVNDTFFAAATGGPIFLYTGNEASISEFIKNTGILLEWAPAFGAMVVFIEHRYYGDDYTPSQGSFPFGAASFTPEHLRYLTVEQAMADFSEVTKAIRVRWQVPPESAVITFGGSYGANLAMWLRLKQPNQFAGAIASSPSVQKHLLRSTNAFWQIVTDAYANHSATCPTLVRAGWDDLVTKAQSDKGRQQLAAELGLCATPPSADLALGLVGWIQNGMETMCQYGYPYPTSFYNPLPAYPWKVACDGMVAAGTPLGALRAAANVYYNYTGQAGSCFNQGAATAQSGLKDLRATSPTVWDAWGYQTCTEVYQPQPSNGLYPAAGGDMFLPSTPDKQAIFADCQRKYSVTPRPEWEEDHLWGPNIQAGSNIFISSGQVDPWRAGGIPSLPGGPASIEFHMNIEGGHHLDIRASNSADPETVVECRTKQQAAIRRWISEWKANPPVPTN